MRSIRSAAYPDPTAHRGDRQVEGEATVKLGEVELFVVTRGRGTPVVLLGGPWFGQTYLGPLADGLWGEFESIAYDPRGSGRSHPVSPPRSRWRRT